MADHLLRETHPAIATRLERANGHLLSVIKMIARETPRIDIAQHLPTIEQAIQRANRTQIPAPMDHYPDAALVGPADAQGAAVVKATAKYL